MIKKMTMAFECEDKQTISIEIDGSGMITFPCCDLYPREITEILAITRVVVEIGRGEKK